jgi:hypothetical protein
VRRGMATCRRASDGTNEGDATRSRARSLVSVPRTGDRPCRAMSATPSIAFVPHSTPAALFVAAPPIRSARRARRTPMRGPRCSCRAQAPRCGSPVSPAVASATSCARWSLIGTASSEAHGPRASGRRSLPPTTISIAAACCSRRKFASSRKRSAGDDSIPRRAAGIGRGSTARVSRRGRKGRRPHRESRPGRDLRPRGRELVEGVNRATRGRGA